jgi:tetratricopeptide (TPR) repeat protein
MNEHARPLRIVVGFLALALALLLASTGAADDNGALREAGKHFQRGVALYGEADYRAALVEFKRAYATAPNVAVLYNVGETEYQLQDYANALTTFERYLTEASASESHRGEVESTMEILRARVGHLTITTTPPGAEVTVDDQAIGRTPFDRSLLVSIGRRKVVATMPGRTPISRYVDVAADDNVSVSLQLPGGESSSNAALLQQLSASSKVDSTSSSGSAGPALRTVGWILTGLSAAGAVSCGLLAMKESSDLAAARASYPTTSATLTRDSNLTLTYSIVADSLTAAAVVLGGITLYSTLSSSSATRSKRGSGSGSGTATRLSVGPGSARFELTF